MPESVQIAPLRFTWAWIEIGIGILGCAAAIWGMIASVQIAPYDEQHGGGMLLASAFFVAWMGVGLICGGVGLRSERLTVRILAHIPLLLTPYSPFFLILGAMAYSFWCGLLTR